MSPSVIEEAREALRVFLGCSYKVDTSIDPRGYSWSEAWLDEARPIASRALAALNEGGVSALTEERAGLAAIRARHDAALARMADNNWPMSEGRQDIAALLAIVDKMRADQ